MRVLWIVNTIFPELAEELNLDKVVYGGWMYGLADALVNNSDIKLFIATLHNGEYLEKKVNNKNYILIPNKDKSSIKNYWKKIKKEYQPDKDGRRQTETLPGDQKLPGSDRKQIPVVHRRRTRREMGEESVPRSSEESGHGEAVGGHPFHQPGPFRRPLRKLEKT